MRLSISLFLVGLVSCAESSPSSQNTPAKLGHTPAPSADRVVTLAPTGTTGPWTVNNVSFTASTMLLLTDGRVLAQDENAADWWVLTPDHMGSYVNGTWSQVASMSEGRLYYASSVLNDGRVVVIGGEYNGGGGQAEDTTGEIYDPIANTWTKITTPSWDAIGDAPNMLLPDGRLLLGSIDSTSTAIWNESTGAWSDGGTKLTTSAEESWVLLANGNVVTVDCSRSQESELWVAGEGWIEGGKLPVDIVDENSEELGPALLLNDGRVIYFGATGHNVTYTPGPNNTGTWTQITDFPNDSTGAQALAADTPAVMLTNGHLLVTAASATNGSLGWGGPTSFFDVDPTANPITITLTTAAANNAQAPYEGRFMLLPTGEVMYTQGSQQVSFFAATTTTLPAPVITQAPTTAAAGSTFTLGGTGFNGISQAVAYGDDASSPTNYPILRLTNTTTNDVTYARTFGFSTMGVALGPVLVTAQVALAATLPAGNYTMVAVANGVPSASVPLQITAAVGSN